ncbi:kinase domain protein [Teladorsagia circumcincta]|uniref:Kinase domain protein n=1 Tax=Teladorsagia circumcincta TaxID=45464 RepID=A0A2G9UWC2_TELCI|nr:kinase domain protein [Teladorsagia circumcincta]
MEYASGGELYDYVSRFGSLPESEARRIFRQITSAVLYCHKHQVAHRDLKLENILLDQDNNAKIADFGLSNYFGTKSLLTTFCGSPLYASPEIINGTPYKGPEVDCWSLGILLYTLVYGSMPFDGRDFNRMVRQIKRGAYYEPDTPSTASMLIRNMLRVNPERRADIFDIASHWWLNLEENMPVIQELPENQDLADETDVFMEFGHLSNETRKKIEEFRRRRKQAEEYNENSPVKPPKTARKDGEQVAEMKSEDKSLRGLKDPAKEKDSDDPLERLWQIENRLGQQRKKNTLSNVPQTASPEKEAPVPFKPPVQDSPPTPKATGATQTVEQKRRTSPEQPEDPKPAPARNEPPVRVPARQEAASRAPSFVPVTNEPETIVAPTKRLAPTPRTPMSAAAYRLEIDSLNMLMNQVLEQMEKGPVSLNLVARIKAHPMYDARPMVKELLESIIAAQPEQVQRETSKLVQQRSQEVARKNQQRAAFDVSKVSAPKRPDKLSRAGYGERPWHSVEVGFDPDEEADLEASHQMSVASAATDVTVQTTSFEDSEDEVVPPAPPKAPIVTETLKEEDEADSEDEEDYTDSEMEELAEEVEQKIVVEQSDALPPPDPVVVQPQYLDAFDRGLVKRQSKGKYQAKKIIMQYPGRPDLSEIEDGLVKKNCVGSLPPRTPPMMGEEHEEATHSEEEAESEACSEEESSEEESETEVQSRQSRGAIIGEVRRDGEPKTPTTASSNYFMTVAELRKPIEPKPYTRPAGSNVISTQVTIEPKPVPKKPQEVKPEEQQMAAVPEEPSTRGKESWESAAAYLRRKNRDRRIRNRTIGSTDEALRDLDRVTESLYDALPGSSLFNYVRPRYHDDSYRRPDDRAHSPPNRYSAAVAREELRAHDHSPERLDFRTAPYGASDVRNYYSSNASPSYTRKFDEPEDSFKVDAYRPGETYRNRFEDSYPYKKIPYEYEKGATSGTDYHVPSSTTISQETTASIPNRFRPTARRFFKSETDRPYIRTRSMDRKQGFGEDYDYTEKHENGLLKKVSLISIFLPIFPFLSPLERVVADPKKKRSILSFNRRRTSEVRMGTDGKLVTNGYDDNSHNKRPSSPIEKIKSLFRKNDNSTATSSLANNDYYTGRYSGSIANDKVYGAYPSTNVAAAREAYVPQYRKYPETVPEYIEEFGRMYPSLVPPPLHFYLLSTM